MSKGCGFLAGRTLRVVPRHAHHGAIPSHADDAAHVERNRQRSVLASPAAKPLAMAGVRFEVVDEAVDLATDVERIETNDNRGSVG